MKPQMTQINTDLILILSEFISVNLWFHFFHLICVYNFAFSSAISRLKSSIFVKISACQSSSRGGVLPSR